METFANSCYALSISAAVALLASCGGSRPPIGAPGAMPQTVSLAAHADRGGLGSFLYVGGWKLSMYALGSSSPLRSSKRDLYVTGAVLAFDRHGHLCEANGDVSAEQFQTYDARTLKLLHVLNGTGTFDSLMTERLGYVYASAYRIYVYAPGCEQVVNVIHSRYGFGALVFDSSGDLYAAGPVSVTVFAPAQKPGHMKFVRRITDGVNHPRALAIGPSGDLFVANEGGKNASVTVYRPGNSAPVRRITNGIRSPWTLAVDSKGRLYVAHTSEHQPGGRSWISVYPPGATRPARKIVDGINSPKSLAIDPSDNVYVMNVYDGVSKEHQTVTVYAPGGMKLLQTITKGAYGGQSLIIGSP
jgi:hypothetical protein